MLRDAAPGIGRQLRKLPGLPALMDARLERIRRRAGRRELRQNAALAAAREADRARLQELGAEGGVRINVGSGPGTLGDGWVNVDIVTDWEGVLYMDVTQPWPLPDGSVDAVNSEHFIEHIPRDDAPAYFAEAARVLRPGGVIRTSTPNLRAMIGAYLEGDPELLKVYRAQVVGWCDARDHNEMFNNTFYQWGHRHIYDFEALAAMLEEAGFESIEPAEFGRSRHPALSGIDIHDEGEHLRRLGLAVDAVKP